MVGVWSLPTDSDSGESVGSGAHGGTFRAMSTTFSASTANDKRCHSLALDKESLESELVLEHSLKRQHNAMHKAGLEAMAARVADLESKLELVASETTVRTEKVSELLALLAKKDGEIATLRSAMKTDGSDTTLEEQLLIDAQLRVRAEIREDHGLQRLHFCR